MAYNTPYQQKLQDDSFHDSDEVAAAWRLVGTQIDRNYQTEYNAMATIATSLNNSYKAYLKKSAEEKIERFSLNLNVTSRLDPSGLQQYHSTLRDPNTVNGFRNMSLVLYHIEHTFGVSQVTLAGVLAGYMQQMLALEEVVAEEIASQLGGSSVITEIPGPSLAGQYKPTTFPSRANGNGKKSQMAFRRRY